MTTMGRWLLDWLLAVVVRAVSWSVCRMPPGAGMALGNLGGALAYVLGGKRRRIGVANLTAAMADVMPLAARRRTIRRVYRHLAWSLVELLRFPRIGRDEIHRFVRVEGRHYVEEALARGRGAILLTAHFGNWELANLYAALVDRPLDVVVRQQGFPRLNALLDRYRQLHGSRIIRKGTATPQILEALVEGRLVGILADQDAGRRWLRVRLFDRITSFPKGSFLCALHAGAPILPVFIVRRRQRLHRIVVRPPLVVPEASRRQERRDIQALCQRYAQVLEGVVRRYPDQWLWLHKRWKSAPVERVAILSDGKAGHLQQGRAVARAVIEAQRARLTELEVDPALWRPREQVVEVVYRSRGHRLVWTAWVWARLPWAERIGAWAMTRQAWRTLEACAADVMIGCGAATTPALVWAGGVAMAKRVAVMAPKPFGPGRFDLVLAPRHDRYPSGPQVVRTATAPNLMAFEPPTAATTTSPPLIGVLIGGDTRRERLDVALADTVVRQLLEAARRLGAGLAVTTSRRTPEAVGRLLRERLGDQESCKRLLLAHERRVEGTAASLIAESRLVVVSSESASMVSEAVASGRPVVAFMLASNGHAPRKRAAFLNGLVREGRLAVVTANQLATEVQRQWERPAGGATHHDAEALIAAARRVVK